MLATPSDCWNPDLPSAALPQNCLVLKRKLALAVLLLPLSSCDSLLGTFVCICNDQTAAFDELCVYQSSKIFGLFFIEACFFAHAMFVLLSLASLPYAAFAFHFMSLLLDLKCAFIIVDA